MSAPLARAVATGVPAQCSAVVIAPTRRPVATGVPASSAWVTPGWIASVQAEDPLGAAEIVSAGGSSEAVVACRE